MPEAVIDIFGKNLSQDSQLADLLAHLIGEKSPKPFECVGTTREIKAALESSPDLQLLLADWGHDGFIPPNLKTKLKSLTHV